MPGFAMFADLRGTQPPDTLVWHAAACIPGIRVHQREAAAGNLHADAMAGQERMTDMAQRDPKNGRRARLKQLDPPETLAVTGAQHTTHMREADRAAVGLDVQQLRREICVGCAARRVNQRFHQSNHGHGFLQRV